MTFNTDLKSNAIPYSCKQCAMQRSCCRSAPCGMFIPENMNTYLGDTIEIFKKRISISKDKRLIRRVTSDMKSYNDKISTLDYYYVGLINDSLNQIRDGRAAYVFTFGQIKDIMRFEQDITVRYVDGCYEIRKVGNKKEI